MKDVYVKMRPVVSSGVVLLVACVASTLDNNSAVENWPWWRRAHEPSLQQVPEGQRTELHCAGRLHSAPALWDYKPCGGRENEMSCPEVINDEREGNGGEWIRLKHDRSSFVLPEVSQRDSGLYRCREAATDHINIYSTLELEVLEYDTEEDPRLPEFLNGLPENVTVNAEGQVIMQCKVLSRSKPTIVWLAEGWGPITYRDRSYSLLNSSGEMSLPGGIYLSKMVISEARMSHAGWYYCLAINTKGFSNHSAYLTVVPSKLTQQTGYSSFYWLFLMPVTLAIIPVLVWTVYLYCRSSAVKNYDGAVKEMGDIDNVQIEMVHLNRPRTIQGETII